MLAVIFSEKERYTFVVDVEFHPNPNLISLVLKSEPPHTKPSQLINNVISINIIAIINFVLKHGREGALAVPKKRGKKCTGKIR